LAENLLTAMIEEDGKEVTDLSLLPALTNSQQLKSLRIKGPPLLTAPCIRYITTCHTLFFEYSCNQYVFGRI
jgi:hypothetical protein